MKERSFLKQIDFTSFRTILIFALIFRLIAAIFSEGYGMHDDHFLIIEAADSWAAGFDYNNWLPWSPGNAGHPDGHSFTYVGINYLFFVVFKFLGIADPKTLMIFNRLLHALFSMLIVHFGIRITDKIAGRNQAVTVGWILALLWMMPFMAVRNLVEMTAIPFLMWGVWQAVKATNKNSFLYAGLLIGMAVSFRYQVGVFAIGMAAYFFFKNQWAALIRFCIGVLLTFCITQGIVDYFIWGYPFAEFLGYVQYNMKEGTQYMANKNYFMYFYVLFGVLLFPFGLLVATGFFASVKKLWILLVAVSIFTVAYIWLPSFAGLILLLLFAGALIAGFMGKLKNMHNWWLLFLPTIFFLLFHTYYPNRQERFILTILPFFIILGVMGYEHLKQRAFFRKAWKFSWVFFWVLNIPLLLFFSLTTSKTSRVDAMYSLYQSPIEDEAILLEATGNAHWEMMPKFYAQSWNCSFAMREDTLLPLEVVPGNRYDYIFFFGEGKLPQRIAQYKTLYPKMELHQACDPSAVDKVLNWLNPRNSNQYIEVWATHQR